MKINLKSTLIIALSCFYLIKPMDISESSDDTSLTTDSGSTRTSRSHSTSSNASLDSSPKKSTANEIEKFIDKNITRDQLIEEDIKKGCYSDAIKALESGKLEDFDALVGEASCQLRSIAVATIARKVLSQGISSLSPQEQEFLTLSYLLTTAKAPLKEFDSEKRALLPDLLRRYIDAIKYPKVGRAPIQKIIQDAQRRLATLSVDFIQKLAAERGDQEIIKALNHVLIDNQQSRFQRPHVGCYASISFILETLLALNYPLVILIRSWDKPLEEKLKLIYVPSNGMYMPAKFDQLNPDEPVVVIGGYSNLINIDPQLVHDKISALGITNIILGTFATHPQFTGSEENKKADIPYLKLGLTNLLNKKQGHIEFAKEHQCSLKHKDLFVSTHIYPSTVKIEFPTKFQN